MNNKVYDAINEPLQMPNDKWSMVQAICKHGHEALDDEAFLRTASIGEDYKEFLWCFVDTLEAARAKDGRNVQYSSRQFEIIEVFDELLVEHGMF